MKIQFLGTASATSYPLPFCGCEICKNARATRKENLRKRSSILINDEMLIDLGPDLMTACFEYNIDDSKIKYLLQTHSHSDHFCGGHLVTRWSGYGNQPSDILYIVASHLTLVDMSRLIKAEENCVDILTEEMQADMKLSLVAISDKQSVQVGQYVVTAFDSLHDQNNGAMIYLVRAGGVALLYATDMLRLGNEVVEYLRENSVKLDCVVLDCTYGHGINKGGHTGADDMPTLIARLRDSGAVTDGTKVYATHLSHEGIRLHRVENATANRNGYSLAFDGMVVEI